MSAPGPQAVVFGLGRFGGGVGATRHLARQGFRVTVTDRASRETLAASLAELADLELELVLGEHRAEDFDAAELVVASPAVRPDHPLLARCRARGARVTSEIELFLEAVDARVACVTGTQGKSSTCNMLAALLAASGRPVHLGGNIGVSLLEALGTIAPGDFVVLELSSYQLEALAPAEELARRVRPVEAVGVTNLLPDHLERHGDLASYAAAKRRVLDLVGPEGVAVLPAEAAFDHWRPACGARRTFGVGVADYRCTGEAFVRAGDGVPTRLARLDELRLPGAFQRENALLALALADRLGVPTQALGPALAGVRGLPHRLELLGTLDGLRVHDNGVSTTPDSTVAALRSLPAGVHLLAGGRSKGLPLDELAAVVGERAGRVTLFGEARHELARALGPSGVALASHATLEDALADALACGRDARDLLFSPACSSFDAYPNFRARALAFRALLPELVTP